MRLLGSALRLTAATVLVAAVGLVLPAGPASAATCASGSGVSVVVDFHELGGGVESACVAGGGGSSATSLFTSAGFGLTYVQRQPGFVCSVAGKPSAPCVNTPPADAYWGLWWSDGKSGQWSYATTSAGGLDVPDGGYVAFSWNGSASRSTPGLSPTAHAASSTPTPSTKPTSKPTSKPTGKASTKPKPSTKPSTKPSGTATKKPSQSASSSPSSTESATPSASPSEQTSKQPSGMAGQPTKPPGGVDGEMLPESAPASTDGTESADAAPASSDPADPSDDGLPTWVGPVVLVALFAAVGTAAVVRRRRNPTS